MLKRRLASSLGAVVASVCLSISVQAQPPGPLRLVPAGSIIPISKAGLLAEPSLASAQTACFNPPPTVVVEDDVSSLNGYVPLSSLSIDPVTNVGDETIHNFNVSPYLFAGQVWTQIGMVSNGYAVVGGGTSEDVDEINSSFPNPDRPNGTLAPFWTDLDPTAGGALRIGQVTDGVNSWIVLDWDAVREYNSTKVNSFEIWIGIRDDGSPVEDITFAYGPLQGNGAAGFMTAGAENQFGNSGFMRYIDEFGELPTNGAQWRVRTTPSFCNLLPLVIR